MPSLQIVSRVVGKKVNQAQELKRGSQRTKKKETASDDSTGLVIGSKVEFPLSNKTAQGTLRFIGPTKFSSGLWCGIELTRPDGRNNGTVKGVKYFQCKFNYGIFVHADKVKLVKEEGTISNQEKTTSQPASGATKTSQSLQRQEGNIKNEDVIKPFESSDEKSQVNCSTESDNSKKPEEGPCGTTLKSSSASGNEKAKGKHQSSGSVNATDSSADDNNEDMKTVLAGELGVENSPLTIKIVKSVSEDDNNNQIENTPKSEFEDGLVFYVTAHQIAPLSKKERHTSCPTLSNSSDEEAVFTDEIKANTWPKCPKDEVRKALDKSDSTGPTKLQRRLSGIEKRIRLSHFRTPSPGTLRKSLSHSAVYPKENYVSYEEDDVRRPVFLTSLKRSVSDVTGYNTNDSLGLKQRNPTIRRPWLRREKTASDSLSSEDDSNDSCTEAENEKQQCLAEHGSSKWESPGIEQSQQDEDVKSDITRNETIAKNNDINLNGTKQDSKKHEQAKIVNDDETTLSGGALVDEESFKAVNAVPDESVLEKDVLVNECSVKKRSNTDPHVANGSPALSKEVEIWKPVNEKPTKLRNSSPGFVGSGLPVLERSRETKPLVQSKSQIAAKISRKMSAPVHNEKKETPKNLHPMSKRISQSQVELATKTSAPKVCISEKERLPKKLTKRVSDLVANFEKTKDTPEPKTGKKLLVSKSLPIRGGAGEKKSPNVAKNTEAANEKEVKRNTLAVVSRKPTRVSQEELAGKEALSKQYFKDNGIAKLGQAEKAKTTGNQATPKANTSTPTGRSGIPGLGKRTPKTQVDTPKKSVVTLRTSTAKHEKEDDSHPVAARADKNQHIKSKDANFTGKEAEEIKALKKKCHDCENRILELKDGFHQKNLAIEAFIIVIKQHIKTIEEQGRKTEQLQHHNKQLDCELKLQTNLAVSNGGKCQNLEREIAEISEKYNKEKVLLNGKYQLEIETLKKELIEEHEEKMGQANAKLEKEAVKLKDYYDDKISKIQEEHEMALKNTKDDFEKAFSLRDEEFSKTKEDIENNFQIEKEEICSEYEERLQDLKDQLALSEQQCNEFETKARELQIEVDKDLESKIQGAIAKYKDLPAELESLQAVVEMKNEDIRKTRTHNMELQKKLEDYYELEKKYVKLSQEKEAIDAALQNKAKCERQLSVEKESLQANLEKESRKVKRLSMEKEELLWKVSNSNSSLSLSSPSLNVDLPSSPNGFQSTPNSSRSFNRSLKTQSLYLPPLDDEDYTVL